MPRRTAVPLFKSRHALLIDELITSNKRDKAMTCHLGVGTGGRDQTIAHIHSSWFRYRPDMGPEGETPLYLRIPGDGDCHKDTEADLCGECRKAGHDGYEPKTPAGSGRQILISNSWTNHMTGDTEYFGLKDAVEDYFALAGPHAPDGVQIGHDMIQTARGGGYSGGLSSKWLRELATDAGIRGSSRRDQLVEYMEDTGNIKDFGERGDGIKIPDMIFHDLRATYCTQLMRCEVPPSKAISKTGHADPESLKPYIFFAADEISPTDERGWY